MKLSRGRIFALALIVLTLAGFALASVALGIAIWRVALTNQRRATAAPERRTSA